MFESEILCEAERNILPKSSPKALPGCVKKENMNSQNQCRMSAEILACDLRLICEILEFYNYPHESAKLMQKFSTKSRKLFKAEFLKIHKALQPFFQIEILQLLTKISCEFFSYCRYKFKRFRIKAHINDIPGILLKFKKINSSIKEYELSLKDMTLSLESVPLTFAKVHLSGYKEIDWDNSPPICCSLAECKKHINNICKLSKLLGVKPTKLKCKTKCAEVSVIDFGQSVNFIDFCAISTQEDSNNMALISAGILHKLMPEDLDIGRYISVHSKSRYNEFTSHCSRESIFDEITETKFMVLSNCQKIIINLEGFLRRDYYMMSDKKLLPFFRSCTRVELRGNPCYFPHIRGFYQQLGKFRDIEFTLALCNIKRMIYKKIYPAGRTIYLIKTHQKENKIFEFKLWTTETTRILWNEIFYLDTEDEEPHTKGYLVTEQFAMNDAKIIDYKEYPIDKNLPKRLQHNLGWFAGVTGPYTVNILVPIQDKAVEMGIGLMYQKHPEQNFMTERSQISLGFKLRNFLLDFFNGVFTKLPFKLIAEYCNDDKLIDKNRQKAFECAMDMLKEHFKGKKTNPDDFPKYLMLVLK